MREPLFLEALHQWDKAQVVVLAEQKIAPPDAIRCLVRATAAMEEEGVVKARTALWNVIHGGEEYMRKFCEEEKSGWLHLGRSSPSLRVVASRIAFRQLLLQIMSASLDLREKLIDIGSQHVETLMPGYSYIQHIEAGTFGFYLMSFVEPLERDFGRLMNAFKNANISAVGTGAAYGIEFDIDLDRMDALLGFDAKPWNARDAIRNFDYMVETYMALALMHNTLGRIAMDFLIWHSAEFGFIRLPDRLSITSSISPQMRIPYVLEFIHGTSGPDRGTPDGRPGHHEIGVGSAGDGDHASRRILEVGRRIVARHRVDGGRTRRHDGEQGAHGRHGQCALVAGEHAYRVSGEGKGHVVPHRAPDPGAPDENGRRRQYSRRRMCQWKWSSGPPSNIRASAWVSTTQACARYSTRCTASASATGGRAWHRNA